MDLSIIKRNIITIIIYMKKFLNSDWLRAVQFLLHAIYGMQLSYSSKFRVAVSGGERTSHVADS
jgi:hypothetical protein